MTQRARRRRRAVALAAACCVAAAGPAGATVPVPQPLPSRVELLQAQPSAIRPAAAPTPSTAAVARAAAPQRPARTVPRSRMAKSTKTARVAKGASRPVQAATTPAPAAAEAAVAPALPASFWTALESTADAPALQRLARLAAPLLLASKDAAAAEVLAWRWMALAQPAEAQPWFEHATAWQPTLASAAYGRALALQAQGRLDEALRAAAALDDPRARALVADLRAQQGQQAYAAGRYADAERWLAGAEPARAHRLMTAWARYNDHRPRQAGDDFAALYGQAADAEAARGWAASLAADGQRAPLRRWAAGDDVLLASAARPWVAEELQSRGLADAAAALQGDAPAQTLALAGIAMRQRGGAAGLDRLHSRRAPQFDIVDVDGARRVALSVARVDLDTGTAAPGAWLGAAQGQADRLNGRQSGLAEARLDWRQQGWASGLFSLGSTPFGAALAPRLTVEAHRLQQTDDGQWRLGVFARPVRSSLLSTAGQVDADGTRWGRVVSRGVEAVLDRRLSADDDGWRLHAEARAMQLEGTRVAANDGTEASLALERRLALPDGAEATVGPRVVAAHYAHNQNHYTLGHGGYFSPQAYAAAGGTLRLRTAEGRRWLAGLEADALLAHQREAAAPCFPGQATPAATQCTGYAASERTGLGGRLRLDAAWLATPQQQLGLALESRRAPDYRDVAVMLTWQWRAAPAATLRAADLNADALRSAW